MLAMMVNRTCCAEAGKYASEEKHAPLPVSKGTHALIPPATAWVAPTWREGEITPVRILGTGGQAVVYLAERNGLFFALKYALVSPLSLAVTIVMGNIPRFGSGYPGFIQASCRPRSHL